MMELLVSSELSDFSAKTSSQRLYCKKCLEDCVQFNVATGYISSESILSLKSIIERNPTPNVNIFIGMHYLESFTETQYKSVSRLNETLTNMNRGMVYLSPRLKFHGKMYSFERDNQCFSASVGSSNFGSFLCGSNDVCEIDSVYSGEAATLIDNKIKALIKALGVPFSELSQPQFTPELPLLDGHFGVRKLPDGTFNSYSMKTTGRRFSIPLKTEAKSNLNAYFGKGRENKKRGFIIPRPWYEVELIVPKSITSLDGYPRNDSFNVITKENYSFECETNGDYAKNFRSSKDLKILGKYIKGNMESSRALEIGNPVDDKVLSDFGYNSIVLSETTAPKTWLLDFGNNEQ